MADLDTFSVLPEERGRGLGGRLLDEVYAELRRRGIGELALAVMEGNDDAVRFYERRGLIPYLTLHDRAGSAERELPVGRYASRRAQVGELPP